MTVASIRGLSESDEDRAFLQRRVALFSLVIGGACLLFWLYRVPVILYLERPDGFTRPATWWHLAAAVFFLMPWTLCRRGSPSVRFISAVELSALTLGVFALCIMSLYISTEVRPDFILLLGLTNVILARSILVPCTGRWTLTLGTIFGAALLATVYVGTLRIDLPKWSAFVPELRGVSAPRAALYATIEVGSWWVLTTVLAIAISYVIYGLRRQVRDAEQLGQYRLEHKLGEGGMGVVYRASHAFLRRPTAVKLLPPEKAGAENLRRFEQEVQLTASLTDPNTITIFDYGHTADGLFYYAMEYVDGLDLSGLVQRSGPQQQGRVVNLIGQAASALVEAHSVGLVHRDIKPSNIMVHLPHTHRGAEDCVKVLDFGLVKQVRGEGGIELTNEANLSGTPQYMAPEAITSPSTVDARSDLYALGAVAYYLLTGTHVFGGATIVEVCSHHLHSTPEAPSSRLGKPIDANVERLILACLEKDASDRPQSAFEFKEGLAACADVPRWTSEDAQRWWASHGEPPQQPTQPPGVERMLTVDVQVDSRGARD
ncbi:MAG: serine/threonine protein kinase [Deltaproteobacteria bacterium]|nr:serine/threonine protein kinase [Deltaproteobacteria bacterium]NND29489.1 serine/threonine protein kinase [Myxococcales bacterium]MBT8463868.1 serine/threonine protein kinase [Deltaproteobacteria bacterium]MBT8481244.1 serine/threonine protein kinase [Deltaproteobacteria bacterium]NNK06106.1 serine/threonine protein kinase [Myxococcales bacterium]